MGDTTGVPSPDLRDNGRPDHHSVVPEPSAPATPTPDPHTQVNGLQHTTDSATNGIRKGSGTKPSASPSPGSNLNPSRVKAVRSNFTVPQPFSLTTEKRASAGSKPVVNGVQVPTPKTQNVAATKKVETPSSQSKIFTPSPKTTPRSNSEFVFRSDERAQKRMEFYANLSEKSKAREAERNRLQANTQQQMAAEIKKLRKDQSFKATPMPKFYQEPAPVRIDVKKTPTTRPKSPKLGRRASAVEGPPRIFARRSSDEYVVGKVEDPVPVPVLVPAATDTKSTSAPSPASVAEEKVLSQQEGLQDGADEVASDHSSSRRSDSVMPRAALSEDEDYISPHEEGENEGEEVRLTAPESNIPKATLSEDEEESLRPSSIIPKAALSVDEEHVSSNEERSRTIGQLADDFDGMLQLPVSSSLLDDDDDEQLGSDFDPPGSDGENELPSPSSDDGHEEPSVRVYISEEFRQAAKAHEGGEEYENEEEDQKPSQKVYVNAL